MNKHFKWPWPAAAVIHQFDLDSSLWCWHADRVRRSMHTPAGVLWSSEGPYVHTLCKVSVVLHSFLPGELSFQWSMKRSIQVTLTGEAFKAKPVYGKSSVGSGNQTLYCEFVDAFCRVNPRACADAISEAQDEWRKVRSNPADVRRRIDELNAMVQKAKCASGWKVTISASPQPSSSSDRSASDRLGSSSSSASASSTSGANATVSARSSVECSVFPRGSSFCQDHIMWTEPLFLGQQNFFFMGAYMHLMYVFVWRGGGGGSTQTNIVRLKQNVDNWRRPLNDNSFDKGLPV